MQVGDYAESLSSSSTAKDAEGIFLDSLVEAALPERPEWDPETLSGFAVDRLLMPLGGLGTDRCSPILLESFTLPSGTAHALAYTHF